MSLFSDAFRDKDPEVLNASTSDMSAGDVGLLREVIGSPTELVDDLKGSINQSLGEYAKWTTTGLLTAVKDPMRFAERQRTMAHVYFQNPDDQLVRDNVQNMISERESKRAILDAADKAALLGRVEAVVEAEEGYSSMGAAFDKKKIVNERMAAIGAMLDTYKLENSEGALTPTTRLDAIKKWNNFEKGKRQGWFYVSKNHMQFDVDPDRDNMKGFDRMPIGKALSEADAHSFIQKHPETGEKQKYVPVPAQTMLHMVIDDAFKDGLRVAKITEWTQPSAVRARIGAPLPYNHEGMTQASVARMADNAAFEVTKAVTEEGAKKAMPVGNVFSNAVDKVKDVIPWGKKAKSEDEASLEASLAAAMGQSAPVGAAKGVSSVLIVANAGHESHVKVAPFDAEMNAIASDPAARQIASKFDTHVRSRVMKNFGVKELSEPNANGARFGKDENGKMVRVMPFHVTGPQHISAAMVTADGSRHNFDAAMFGYKIASEAAQNDIHEVGFLHLKPTASADHPRTLLYETGTPATGGRSLKDVAQHSPNFTMTMPSASNLEKSMATATGYGAEYNSTSAQHRAGVKVFEFE